MNVMGSPEPWMEHALCRQTDPDLWFPEIGSNAVEAKRICSECPVRVQCLEYAVEHYEEGIWAGTSRQQRQRLRREEGTAA